MRIVHVTPELPDVPGGGGIGTYTATMARALARLGHDVVVVTEGPAGEQRRDGIRVVSLEHRWLPVAAARTLATRRRTARAVAALAPDVVQASEWEATAWWIARRGTAPLVTRLATPTYLVEELNQAPRPQRPQLVERLERDQAARSAGLVAPSRALAMRVALDWGLSAGQIEVIPNPIDGDSVRRAGAARPPVALPTRFLAFIGRLERRKGIETLAAALPWALAAEPELHAVLIGRDAGTARGGFGALVRQRAGAAADRVHLLGELPRDTALAVLARAQLVVLPSLWEAFGFVATEAMALGLPVVASSGSGFGEIIHDGVSGWLVPPGDAEALGRTLVARLADHEQLARIGGGARLRAADFEADRLAPALVAVYERARATAPGGGRFTSAIYTGPYRHHFRPEDRRGPFHRLYERKRDAVIAHFDALAPMRLLDAGCGPGRLTAPLARRHRMTGCDISQDMLAEARLACPPDVELVLADARRLPFADGQFDGVLALDLLVHLPDLEAGLRELARVVRPGGHVVFDTSNAAPWWVPAYPAYFAWRPRRMLATMRRGGVLPEWAGIVRHHRGREARKAIAAAGLDLTGTRRFGPPWTAKWQLWITRRAAT